MGHDVRFLIFNRQEQCSTELRAALLKTSQVKIVAEVDEPALLEQAVDRFHAEAILVNLDPCPEETLNIIGPLILAKTNTTVFAISESTDGPLILKTMRLGVREFLTKPIDVEVLTKAVQKIESEKSGDDDPGQLITVMGASGGVGATFMATNLAVELANLAKERVVIVDLDYRFGQVATVLDVEPTYTLSDLCESPDSLEPQVLERALIKHSSGVRVLSRPSSFAEADTMTAASCVGLLTMLTEHNDYVVVDGPNRSDVRAKSVLDIADVNLLLVQLLVPCIRNATRILTVLREGGDGLERTKLIPNRVGRGAVDLSIEDAARTLNLDAYASLPDDWMTVSGAINLGVPLLTHSPKSKVRIAIQEIAERLHGPVSQTDESSTSKKSLIGRIFANG